MATIPEQASRVVALLEADPDMITAGLTPLLRFPAEGFGNSDLQASLHAGQATERRADTTSDIAGATLVLTVQVREPAQPTAAQLADVHAQVWALSEIIVGALRKMRRDAGPNTQPPYPVAAQCFWHQSEIGQRQAGRNRDTGYQWITIPFTVFAQVRAARSV